MNSREILPVESLRNHVRCFRLLEAEAPVAPKTFKVIVAGRPGLIFQEDPQAFLGPDGKPFPRLFLHGQTTRSSEKTAVKGFRNIQVDFHPQALYSVFGMEADALTNGHVDLDSLPGGCVGEQLANAASPEKRVGILSEFLVEKIRRNRRSGADLLREMLTSRSKRGAGPSLSTLRSDLNLSERSLERMFRRQIGISPRLFARVSRFQAALRHAENGRATLTQIAYGNGYADASHCIREFKEFAGAGPASFRLLGEGQLENFPEWKS